jgi:hypothetical protein
MNTLFRTSAIALVLSATPLAMAQSTPAPDNRPPMNARGPHAQGAQGPGQHAHGAQTRVAPTERIEARIAYAQSALKITDAQKPQWERFVAVLRSQAGEMEQRMAQRHAAIQGTERKQLNAVERLEQRQQFMAEASKRMGDLLAAGKPLYAAFTPEQQKVADGLLNRQGHGGHHRPASFHGHGAGSEHGRGHGHGMR